MLLGYFAPATIRLAKRLGYEFPSDCEFAGNVPFFQITNENQRVVRPAKECE